jgi:hypothetical protein
MFDPYEKWLHIPKDQRPIDYFLLLDIDRDEKDPDAIREAAQRQASRVTKHKDGPFAADCARLLKEIQQGRNILLEPAKRKAYENKLRQIAADEEDVTAVEVVEEEEETAVEVVEEEDEEAAVAEVVEEDEDEKPPPKTAIKKATAKKAAEARAFEDDEDDEEEERPSRAAGKKKGAGKRSKKEAEPEESSKTWLWVSLAAAVLLLAGGGVTAFLMTREKKTDTPTSATGVASASQSPPSQPPGQGPEKEQSLPKLREKKEPEKKEPEKKDPPKEATKPADPPKPPPAALPRPPAARAKSQVAKLPVPDAAAQEKATKAIQETYKADYAKTKPEDYLALAAKLLQPGRENRADPTAWFTLLREARDLAVKAGRPRLAVEAVSEMDRWFVVDAFALKLEVLARVTEGSESGARAAAKTALSHVETALDADNYPAAMKLIAAAETAARKPAKPDEKQLARITHRRSQVQGYAQLYEVVAKSREKLTTAPADVDSNLLVGKHLCSFQGRWDEGLPVLARAGNDDDAKLARLDLTPPADVKAQVAVGDGWWKRATEHTGRQKWHLQQRALAWYELAGPNVAGEDRTRVTERIIEGIRASAARIPRLLPGSFLGRNDIEDRTLLLREGGGNMRSEEAIEKGLAWLAAHQHPSGKWSADLFHKVKKECNCTEQGKPHDIAATAFGLLPFLGAGHTHQHGHYASVVRRGLTYLQSEQKKKADGNFHDNAYENGLATIAVCEAYGQSKDKKLRPYAQAAVNYIVKAQYSDGSWGYSSGSKGDTSVSGWQFSALKAAHFAGLGVPADTFIRTSAFLDSVADASELGYGYNSKAVGRATSATGLLCRAFLGWGPTHPIQAKGIKHMIRPDNFVTKDRPSIYFIFYAHQAMHHTGGEDWEAWNPKVRDMLIELQDQGTDATRSHQKGSWSPAGDDYAAEGGRLMFTSLALLTLETYYYHVPLNGFGPAVLLE